MSRLGRARRHAHVDRLEDAAVERHQVRHERHRDAQLLLDLGGVPVREDAVGRQAAVHFGEVRPLGRRLAGARDARLGVDDDVGRRRRPAPAPAARAPAAPPSGSSPGRRRAARLQRGRGRARSGRRPCPRAAPCVAGYQRARTASSRSRKAPDRSMTRTPRASSAGASSADASFGQRQEHDVVASRAARDRSGSISPSQMPASAGRRTAVLAAFCDAIAAVRRTCGCRASRRTSSCPVYPVAPATPTVSVPRALSCVCELMQQSG